MEPRYIVCWLSIYFGISSSSLFHVALVNHVVRFRCAALVDLVVEVSSPEITESISNLNSEQFKWLEGDIIGYENPSLSQTPLKPDDYSLGIDQSYQQLDRLPG